MLKSYEEPIEKLDSTLARALHAAEEKMLHQFDAAEGKVGRAENFRTGVLDHKSASSRLALPERDLQERTLCALPFLAAYRPELLDDLAALAFDP